MSLGSNLFTVSGDFFNGFSIVLSRPSEGLSYTKEAGEFLIFLATKLLPNGILSIDLIVGQTRPLSPWTPISRFHLKHVVIPLYM